MVLIVHTIDRLWKRYAWRARADFQCVSHVHNVTTTTADPQFLYVTKKL